MDQNLLDLIRIVFGTFVFALVSSLASADSAQPNIILIYVDDMGVGDVSYTEGRVMPTPNIDKLAAGGKVIENYYTSAPVCSPSRVGVATGMFPIRWDINTYLSHKKHNQQCDQSDFLDVRAPSIARRLKTVGYRTAHIGKWHMGGGRDVTEAPQITEYGFDEYLSTWESPDPDPVLTSSNWIWAPEDTVKRWDRTSYFVDKTLEFLKKNKGKPCYVNLWPDDVHTPWVSGPAELNDAKEGYFEMKNLKPVLTELDTQIGRLMHGLRVLGLEEKTLIIFTSDNGPAPSFEHQRTNGLRGLKNSLYEGGIRMPFIVYWPGKVKAGQRDTKSIVSAVDLFPTLCSIAGTEMPDSFEFDGEDVSEVILGTEIYHKRQKALFWEHGRRADHSVPKEPYDNSPVLAMRAGDWKCFTSFDGSELELYNLVADPMESKNQVVDCPVLADQMRQEMLQWFAENNESEVR